MSRVLTTAFDNFFLLLVICLFRSRFVTAYTVIIGWDLRQRHAPRRKRHRPPDRWNAVDPFFVDGPIGRDHDRRWCLNDPAGSSLLVDNPINSHISNDSGVQGSTKADSCFMYPDVCCPKGVACLSGTRLAEDTFLQQPLRPNHPNQWWLWRSPLQLTLSGVISLSPSSSLPLCLSFYPLSLVAVYLLLGPFSLSLCLLIFLSPALSFSMLLSLSVALSVCTYLSFCLSLSLCSLCLSLLVCHPGTFTLCLFLWISLRVSTSLHLSLSLCLSLYLSLAFSLPDSLSLCLCPRLPLSPPLSVSVYFSLTYRDLRAIN